jgi:oligosaccharide 4-alpha-D-glucosyltransferase
MWGDAFLVTPVIAPDVKSVAVNVPNGVWFDYWTDKKIIGNKVVHIPVSLETIPVLVRAGAFVPTIDDIDSTKHYSSEKLTLHYYADKSVKQAEGMMYEDDGESRNTIQSGEFEKLNFSATQTKHKLSIAFEHSGQGYSGMPSRREITLVIHNQLKAPKHLLINDKAQQQKLESKVIWDEQAKTITIKFTWANQPVDVEVS